MWPPLDCLDKVMIGLNVMAGAHYQKVGAFIGGVAQRTVFQGCQWDPQASGVVPAHHREDVGEHQWYIFCFYLILTDFT